MKSRTFVLINEEMYLLFLDSIEESSQDTKLKFLNQILKDFDENLIQIFSRRISLTCQYLKSLELDEVEKLLDFGYTLSNEELGKVSELSDSILDLLIKYSTH